MKNKLNNVFILALVVINFMACSDNDGPIIRPQELNKNFGTDAGTKLTITYSGESLTGKIVSFHTDDSKTATLTLADIIPGESQMVISNILLKEAEGQYTFDGSIMATPSSGAKVDFPGV